MKFSYKKKKVLIIFIGVLFILSLNFFQKEVKNFFYLISLPIQERFWRAGDRVSDFFETVFEIKNLKKENEELRLGIRELLAINASLRESGRENQVLREALEIGLQKDFKLTLAEIVGKDIDQDSILINKGSRDGILKGMPAITQQKALLGKISEVYGNFSRILLISSKESSFDAKIQDASLSGVVKGRGSLKLFLDLIPQDKIVKEGDLVVSSLLGGIYPEGLLVGLIKEAKRSDITPFYKAEISPFFDIEELENIFIILDF